MGYKNREAQREYQRKWIAQRRSDWLTDKCCVVCGSTENLEVDHLDRTGKVDHRVWSWKQARRDAELAKCQVLCGKHHLEKTIRESEVQTHGLTMYKNHGCRCDVCRAAKKIDNASRYGSVV